MNAIITFALKQRVLMFVLMIFAFVAGGVGFMKLNIEAYPDPVPPHVAIVTQSTGQSAEEIQR
jgi:cobalt-zinc-cadmium resistance protein CzcA